MVPLIRAYFIILSICVYLSYCTSFTENYYLSPTSSFNETWNSIYNNIYNGSFNVTYHNNTILTDNYIFNITIISNLTVTGVTYIDLPYFDHINRITIDIYCMEETDLCPIYIANNSTFIMGSPNYNPTATHITLRMSNIIFHLLGGQTSLLQIYDSNIIDIIELNNVMISCYSYCLSPISIRYLSSFETNPSEHYFTLNSIGFNNIALPLYIVNGGNINLNNIVVNECISGGTDDLFHFENVYEYNISNMEIYNSIGLSLIYISTAPFTASINLFTGAIFNNNTVYSAAIQIQHGWSASSTDIWTNVDISDIYYAAFDYGLINFEGSLTSLYLTNVNIQDTYDSYWTFLFWQVDTVYIDSCYVSDTSSQAGVIGSHVVSLYIHNSIIQHTQGFGVYYYPYYGTHENTVIENTLFQHNTHTAVSPSSVNNMNITNCTFIENRNAIWSSNVNNMKITNCTFTGNTAATNTAGAVYVNVGSLTINGCIFEQNNAFRFGGAVAHQYGKLFIYNSIFRNNSAYHGGAIWMHIIHFTGTGTGGMEIYNTMMIDNIAHNGGAIRSDRGTYYLQNVTFHNNTAKADGGAINDVMATEGCEIADKINKKSSSYTYAAHVGPDTVFKQNSARYGGAIYSTNCNMYIDSAVFANNTGITSGGAVLFDVSTSNITVFNTEFISNFVAHSGGGAVSISGGNIVFNQCMFSHNSANHIDSIGGAILLQVIDGFVDDDTSTFIFNSVLQSNVAPSGGGIAVQMLGINGETSYDYDVISYLLNIENVTMRGNAALKHCGGAVYLDHGTINFANNNIMNNKAVTCGGGVYVENGAINVMEDVYDNNMAGDYGGGLVTNSVFTKLINVDMNNNSAVNYGGGIYIQQCPIVLWQGLEFDEYNNAMFGGADIFMMDKCNDFYNGDNNASLETVPISYNISWEIPTEFSHFDELVVLVNLFDGFGSKVTILSPNDRFIISLMYTSEWDNCLLLIGGDVTEFSNDLNGDLKLKFNIQVSDAANCSSIYAQEIKIAILFNLSLKHNGDLVEEYAFAATYFNAIFSLPLGIVVFGHLTNVICTLSVMITAFFMYKHRKHRVIKGSRISFMMILIIGLLLLSFVESMFVEVPWTMSCASYVWMFSISFLLIFAPVAAKTWSIYRVFEEAQNLKIFYWDAKKLFIVFVAIPFVFVFILLLCWTLIEGANDTILVFDTSNKYLVEECAYNNAWLIVAFVIVFMGVIFLAYLAVKARHVPENYRESKYIFLCILTLFLIFLFFIPLSFIQNIGTTVQRVIRIISVFLCIQSILIFLFYTKFNIVWNGKFQKESLDLEEEEQVISQIEASSTNKSKHTSNSNRKSIKKMFSLFSSSKKSGEAENNNNAAIPPPLQTGIGMEAETVELEPANVLTDSEYPHDVIRMLSSSDIEFHD